MERLRWVVTLLALGLLLLGLYSIITPFFEPLLWAVVLVLSTWPLYSRIERVRFFKKYPAIAALTMTLMLAGVIVLAIAPMIAALGKELQGTSTRVEEFLKGDPEDIHATLLGIPYVGEQLDGYLQQLMSERHELVNFLSSNRANIFELATGAARGVFSALFKIFMCLFIVYFLYLHGDSVAAQVRAAGYRLGGERFIGLLSAIRATVKAVVYGMLATAGAQGVLAGIGYIVAGAPVPILLGFVTMIFSLIPFGTPLVYLPVCAWIVLNGAPWLHGALLAAWGIAVVSGVDNILRPLFISQATRMPLVLVFVGVVGGVISYGLIGLFIGPVLIAVAQVLWVELVTGRSTSEQLPE